MVDHPLGLGPFSCQAYCDQGANQPVTLSLFKTVRVAGSSNSAPPTACLAYVGGPACALSWRPDGHADGTLQLALAARPETIKRTTGAGPAGQSLLQIWAFRPDQAQVYLQALTSLQEGYVQGCSWCADSLALHSSGNSAPGCSSPGLLAVLSATGTIEILIVPGPSKSPEAEELGSPPPVQPPDLHARAAAGTLGTSCPSTLAWLPHPPHNLLLVCPWLTAKVSRRVGCWDGTVALFRVKAASSHSTLGSGASSDEGLQGMELLSHYSASTDAVRAVIWAPSEVGDGGAAEGCQWGTLFAVAGQAQQVTVWDARDPCQPVATLQARGESWTFALAWATEAIIAAGDDGSVQQLSLVPDPGPGRFVNSTYQGSLAGAMWALDFCQSSGRAVYAGRDGQALISSPHFLLKQRRRSPHSCFAGAVCLQARRHSISTVSSSASPAAALPRTCTSFRQEGQAVRLCLGRQAETLEGAFTGEAAPLIPVETRVAEQLEGIRCMELAPRPAGTPAAWAAFAGEAGLLVICQVPAV